MQNKLQYILLIITLLATPIHANDQKTQAHLQTLLGELLHLEQQVDVREKGEDTIMPGAKYLIKAGDSLGDIVQRAYGRTNIRLDLVMELIVRHNPTAFFRNNPNFVYADKVITIPSVDDFRNMLFTTKEPSLLNDSIDKSHWIRFP